MKTIRIRGASEHNLRDLSLDLPRDALAVFTGVSGSGKSSLVFDTLYKEGRRRFLDSLSSYARGFLGGSEKPRVDSIEGLSPAVSIEQKTVQRSRRSTVGTITEIYDHLRLLFARLGTPHCPDCGREIEAQSAEQVVDWIYAHYPEERLLLCAPIVRDRKGEYRKELERLRRDGYRRLRIDGEVIRLGDDEIRLERNRNHSIDIVYDRIVVDAAARSRMLDSIEKCFALADQTLRIVTVPREGDVEERLISGRFACADCGISLPELEPRLFSFNSPHGMCTACQGLGEAPQLDAEMLVVDPSKEFRRGGLAIFTARGKPTHKQLDLAVFRALGEKYAFHDGCSWGDLSEEARRALLDGDGDLPGLAAEIERVRSVDPEAYGDLLRELPCRVCDGARLSALARAVRFRERSLPELCRLPIGELVPWLQDIEWSDAEQKVGEPIEREVLSRLGFLADVGLAYLTLERNARSLAGGEAQRIRLASQVGSGLQGVLFVLDEPSIGLHPRDNRRLLRTLEQLRDLGNTVYVVEHDRETMEIADWIVDLGPGAGVRGGELVAEGELPAICATERSLTGQYLEGRRRIELPAERRVPGSQWIELTAVSHRNLQEIDVRFPLGLLVAVTGVSGSGKSSLVRHVLRPALLRKLGRDAGDPGRHRALLGYQHVDKVIDIDQSPIGRSPRSNPATYTKCFGLIRELFAKLPEARARGYPAGRFSFNVEGGRCTECRGAGVQEVNLQFLAPVEVVCEVCGGYRYNRETLEILYRGHSIYEVLEMTISEARELFRDHPRIERTLSVLETVGLGYLGLGQSSTTLSGGEAQRLKLANELQKRDTGQTLYILDEPTTGLHFEDVRVLLEAIQRLVERGNTVLVIEHDMDVVKTADWVIDLGPEGGDGGGQLVAFGTPEQVAAVDASYTGQALSIELGTRPRVVARAEESARRRGEEPADEQIRIEGARMHNLQGIDVQLPRGKMSVITGVSGSGKTSLAFDTIFAEGQRRYVDSLSTYARQFLGRLQAPPVDKISGLSPAIAIDQKSAGGGPRSTVATITELHDYLRLLFAHVGTPHCPDCGKALRRVSSTQLAARLVAVRPGEKTYIFAPVRLADTEESTLRGTLTRLVASGFTRALIGETEVRLDDDEADVLRRVLQAFRDLRGSLGEGADPEEVTVRGLLAVVDRIVVQESAQTRIAGSLEQAYERGEGVLGLGLPGKAIEFHTRTSTCPDWHFRFEGELTPRMFSFNSFEGACERCAGTGTEMRAEGRLLLRYPERGVAQSLDPTLGKFLEKHRPSVLQTLGAVLRARGVERHAVSELSEAVRGEILHGTGDEMLPLDLGGVEHSTRWEGLAAQLERWARDSDPIIGKYGLESLFRRQLCSVCQGKRLRPEFLAVRVGSLAIDGFLASTIGAARTFLGALELSDRQAKIVREVLREMDNRLGFLESVGLGYLALDRSARTLSGGEAQRIRLASQLGNRLVGVLYVLDEPTVGLHQRDTARLLASLEELRNLGNTILLVEHDREAIEAADWVVDIGPGAGKRGGRVVAAGTPAEVARQADSATGRYLAQESKPWMRSAERPPAETCIELDGVTCHNLRDVDVRIPEGRLTVVTGVSGSGKSSLVLDVLATVARAIRSGETPPAGLLREQRGLGAFERVVVIDQRPIGRSPKSTPVTYTGAWELIRKLYSTMAVSKERGYKPGRFSFNSPDGRCAKCEGQGAQQIEMQFLSDVWIRCDACKGLRYNESTLEVVFRGKTIADLLDMEVGQAREFFENQPGVLRILETLDSVGLGYVQLGQSATTLSGGEAQRVKLAAELVQKNAGPSLYVLDEPTTGLHFEDVERLIGVFEQLVDQGHTVVVIEHQLDVIACADWVIDLGPEAGDEGGRVVATGRPQEIAQAPESRTGEYLRKLFETV